MKAYTSQKNEYLFFNNHQLLKNYVAASENTKMAIPGSHYFKMLETFIEKRFEIGEKYLEYFRYACLDPSCYHCSALGWTGPVCSRVPKPMPNYNSSGFHYLSVFETPVETDGNTRPVDDFQPRKQVKDYMAHGKLVTEEEIEEFSKKFITDKLLLKKYIEHLRILEMNKRKRFEKRQVLLEEQKNKKFEEYDWLSLLREGALKKLKVNEPMTNSPRLYFIRWDQ